MIEEKFLCKSENEQIKEFTLKGKNLVVKILNYGAIIKNVIYNGVDVALGYDSFDEYFKSRDYYGACVGRVCNRISNGSFFLNGKEYQLSKNSGENSLHGGFKGFNKRVFDYEIKDDKLILSYLSRDGEEGYPANLNVKVIYYVLDDDLHIEYLATSDKDTVCSLTNHSYFNLNGEGSGNVLAHKLQIKADSFLPINEKYFAYGEILPVKNTPFDFNEAHNIGDNIDNDNPQQKITRGYDNAFILSGEGFRKVATVIGDKTKIKMDVLTDQKSLQLYVGYGINDIGKGGKKYQCRSAVCLETQSYPNAVNCPNFPSIVLKKGDTYSSKTIYRFYCS